MVHFANFLGEWDDAERWLAGATRLSSLEIGETTHIACQPALEFSGRMAEWVAEIRRARDRGDTIVFVAHSPGRAERTIELLRKVRGERRGRP